MNKRWGALVRERDWKRLEEEEEEEVEEEKREGDEDVDVEESSAAGMMDQFEKVVVSKYKDAMLGFQTEFMVCNYFTVGFYLSLHVSDSRVCIVAVVGVCL